MSFSIPPYSYINESREVSLSTVLLNSKIGEIEKKINFYAADALKDNKHAIKAVKIQIEKIADVRFSILDIKRRIHILDRNYKKKFQVEVQQMEAIINRLSIIGKFSLTKTIVFSNSQFK